MFENLHSVAFLIPAYKPQENLVQLTTQLSQAAPNSPIIIVNDGSGNDFDFIFSHLKSIQNVHLCTHKINQGKGNALKTGFEYYISTLKSSHKGLVTLDADGQHLIKDCIEVAATLAKHPTHCVLGVREFSKDIPFRSQFGNILTRKVFKWLHQIDLQDTQTGLRGMGNALIKLYLTLPQAGYDFETACLIATQKHGFVFNQVGITTVYENNNASSHFNPIIDSIKIYMVFLRFIFLSISSFVLDIVLFYVMYHVTNHIYASTLGSRIISGSFNFYYGKMMVFRAQSPEKIIKEAISYTALALLLVFLSSYLVTQLQDVLPFPIVVVKIITDSLLFILSFCVQKLFIFKADAGYKL